MGRDHVREEVAIDRSGPGSPGQERVSLVVPMRNEVAHVERLVRGIAAQDYEGELEVIVADGCSTDGSAQAIRELADAHGVELIVLENPDRLVSHGLNACIRRARGDLIVRLDCHSRYPTDYVRRLVDLAAATGAWNVGGAVEPRGSTTTERAVACAMDGPFGGIGWTAAAAHGTPLETDTVTYGAFRHDVFARVGLFDETLVRNQDDELNARIRAAGGRIVLDPSIVVEYTPRGSLRGVFRQYYEYGFWKVPVMLKHRRALGLRSMAPLAATASFVLLGAAAPASATSRRLFAVETALYASCALGFATASLRRRAEPLSLLPRVAAVYPMFHFGYGLGMASGWLRRLRSG